MGIPGLLPFPRAEARRWLAGGVSEWEFPVCYHSRAPRRAVGSPSIPERKGDAGTESRRSRGSHDCRVATALPPRSQASSAAIAGSLQGTHGVLTGYPQIWCGQASSTAWPSCSGCCCPVRLARPSASSARRVLRVPHGSTKSIPRSTKSTRALLSGPPCRQLAPGLGLAPATSAPGLGAPPPTSASGLSSPHSHLRSPCRQPALRVSDADGPRRVLTPARAVLPQSTHASTQREREYTCECPKAPF